MSTTLKDRIENLERAEILNALKDCNWVQARAARKLGITERMIGYKVKKYAIKIKEVTYGKAAVNNEDVNYQNIDQKNKTK